MNQITKGVVITSTVAAAALNLYLATTPQNPSIWWFSLISAAILFLGGGRLRSVFLPLILVAMLVMPTVYLQWLNYQNYGLEIIWILPLLGLILSGRDAWRWSLPSAWQWPLTTWALVVAMTWPIVFLRESDFTPWILPLPRVSNSSIGISPWEAGLSVTYFALGHLLGILWIDALWRWFGHQPARFIRLVAAPLSAAAALASAVAVYQGFVDLNFLNSGFWAYMGRTAGTLGDANTLGMVAALLAPVAVVLAQSIAAPWSFIVAIGGMAIAVAAVWTSSSRTGLAALLIGLTAIAVEAARRRLTTRRQSPLASGRTIAGVAAGVLLAALLVVALSQTSTTTVIDRGLFEHLSLSGDQGPLKTLYAYGWERFGYGPAAIQMIRENPLSGVGTGAFHTLVHDYGKLVGYDITPDNAQNWVRHLLAEFGLLGSVPWVWWCGVLLALLFSKLPPGADRFSAGVLRGALIAFGLASMFGMPGQSIPLAVTFWILVFWFAMARAPQSPVTDNRWATWPTTVVTVLLIFTHTGLTLAAATGDLLPRHRAMRFNWFYRYGLMDLDPDPAGGVGRRWTMKESLAVIPVQGKVLKFVGWIDHPDGDERPVRVRVWADSVLVYDADLKRSAAIHLDLAAKPGATHLVLQTWISRTWRPTDFGRRDQRELGLSVRDWIWEGDQETVR